MTETHSDRAPAGEDELTPILDVEPIEEDYFRGIAAPEGKGRSFGGQVVAQALSSATRTVGTDRPAHSLHAYFMRPGDATKPVLYRVERDRDGGSFATRRVVAVQNGKPILNLACSFQIEEDGISYQDEMPEVPGPEGLPNEQELAERHRDRLHPVHHKFLTKRRPIEVRPCEDRPPFVDTGPVMRQAAWMRSQVALPDDPHLHRAALAYTSDLGLIGAALTRAGTGFGREDMMVASLDHALWLHGAFRMDEWLLYEMNAPWAGGARGFTRGRIFTRDGRLVADVAQEGLIRQITPKG